MTRDNYLYNKAVKLTFDSLKHAYFYEGEKVPSVTTILSVIAKPALINWSANMAADYFKAQIAPGISYDEIQLNTIWKEAKSAHYKKKVETGDIGTFVHNWVENYIKGIDQPVPTNDGLRESTERFLKWQTDHKVKFLASEQVVYSRVHNYSGTLDFICTIGGRLVLGDLKTSSGIYDEYWLQTAAYRQARTEEYPQEKYVGQAIIRIGRDGDFEFVESDDYQTHINGFIAALELHKVLDKLKNGKK